MTPLWLLIGLLVGYYGRQIYDMVHAFYEEVSERRLAQAAGVVKPEKKLVTSNQEIDLSTDSGPVRRPTPVQASLAEMSELSAQRERNQRLRNG